MRRFLIPLSVLVATLALTVGVATAGTCTTQVPMGAIAPAVPIWCFSLTPGNDTHVGDTNSWADDFNHGQSNATLNSSYTQGFIGNGDVLHFQHNQHWMVDIESGGSGALIGAWMRPNRSFRPQADGTLVVEFEVAGPIAGTREVGTLSDSWPELTLSTAAKPPGMQSWGSEIRRNGTYLYEAFPGYWTFGCRMQQSRHPICALYMDDYGTAGTKPSRRWEINQNGGDVTSEFGGDPAVAPNLGAAWNACTSTQDPDVICRNKFRWEIRANEVKLFANGTLFYQAGLIDSNLNNILNAPGGVYVFFGDFAYRMDPGRALRFHWDHLAVNPGAVGGPTPTPVPPTATPVATATPGPGANTTVTFDDRAGQDQALNGQYPTGVIDWGSNTWYHSGPWGAFTTKSVSFNGAGLMSASFNFVSPRQLVSVQAYNGGAATTVTLSCAGQTTRTQAMAAGATATISTNWTGPCSTVTVSSTNGWDTNFDNLTYR